MDQNVQISIQQNLMSGSILSKLNIHMQLKNNFKKKKIIIKT